MSDNNPNKLLDLKQAAELLNISPRTLYQWIRTGHAQGLKVIQLRHVQTKQGKRPKSFIRFRRQDLDEWIAVQVQEAAYFHGTN